MESLHQKLDLFVIALDGPAGSGKSTIARQLSQMLKIEYIDSGAIYRTFTLFGIKTFNGQCQGNEQKIAKHFKFHSDVLKIEYKDHTQKMILMGDDVSAKIRTPEVTLQIKHIANNIECRELVNQTIRETARKYSVVIDGRDIGTIVFPDTPFKFYLDAKTEVRATRRALEMKIPTVGEQFNGLLTDIKRRDQEDITRTIGPLAIAKDATIIDTSELSIEQVLLEIKQHLSKL
ncbi:MAG: (d)CMP kinase [Deltaproteobacteria bacterium]|nr:(d)CMP kinase [Deltaproteobacteria bacterium]MBT4528115.1 (d)CMP kinase [Deltaproteobacteria bacterium]